MRHFVPWVDTRGTHSKATMSLTEVSERSYSGGHDNQAVDISPSTAQTTHTPFSTGQCRLSVYIDANFFKVASGWVYCIVVLLVKEKKESNNQSESIKLNLIIALLRSTGTTS